MADGNPAPSKRRNERDLTKDNYEDEVEDMAEPAGGWQKADEETLKRRKIVKVRRPGEQPVSQPTAAANPFAGVSLFPASDTGPSTAATAEGPKEPTTTETLPSGMPVLAGSSISEPQNVAAPSPAPEHEAAGAQVTEQPGGPDSTSSAPAAATAAPLFTSFATSTTSPFSLLGTGAKPFGTAGSFTGSAGGFGSLAASAGAATFGVTGAPASGAAFSFGVAPNGGFSFPPIAVPSIPSGGATGLGSSAGGFGGVLFGSSGGSTAASLRLQPAEKTVTGEEDETTVFTADGILFEYDNAGKGWRERGRGEVRVNEKRGSQARLLMRQKGNFKLILNAMIYPQMAVTPMSGGGITFSCFNAAATTDTPDKGAAAKAEEVPEAAAEAAPSTTHPKPASEAGSSTPAADAPKEEPATSAKPGEEAAAAESAERATEDSTTPAAKTPAAAGSTRLATYALRVKAPEKLQHLKDVLERIKREGAGAGEAEGAGPDSFV